MKVLFNLKFLFAILWKVIPPFPPSCTCWHVLQLSFKHPAGPHPLPQDTAQKACPAAKPWGRKRGPSPLPPQDKVADFSLRQLLQEAKFTPSGTTTVVYWHMQAHLNRSTQWLSGHLVTLQAPSSKIIHWRLECLEQERIQRLQSSFSS